MKSSAPEKATSGVQTAAFNLPNDERVVKEKGSERIDVEKCSGREVQQSPDSDFARCA